MKFPSPAAIRRSTAGILLLAAGCSSEPTLDTAKTEAVVKGVVKLNGKPATEGEIIFDPANYQRNVPKVTAPIGKDGTYEIKTLVGDNMVTLGGVLPKKYGILQYRKFIFTAAPGDNTYDFVTDTK